MTYEQDKPAKALNYQYVEVADALRSTEANSVEVVDPLPLKEIARIIVGERELPYPVSDGVVIELTECGHVLHHEDGHTSIMC
jgi:hypothetical protein